MFDHEMRGEQLPRRLPVTLQLTMILMLRGRPGHDTVRVDRLPEQRDMNDDQDRNRQERKQNHTIHLRPPTFELHDVFSFLMQPATRGSGRPLFSREPIRWSRARSTHPVKEVLHKTRLSNHGRRQHEWKKVRSAHAAIDAIDGPGVRKPAANELIDAGSSMRIKVNLSAIRYIIRHDRIHPKPE